MKHRVRIFLALLFTFVLTTLPALGQDKTSASTNQPAPLSPNLVVKNYPVSNYATLYLTFPRAWHDLVTNSAVTDPHVAESIQLVRPSGGFSAVITVIPAVPRVTQPTIRRSLTRTGTATLPDSVETNLDVIELKGAETTGYYYCLTDKSLVGQPESPVKFKHQMQGYVKIGLHAFSFSAFYNEPDGPDYRAIMEMVKTAHLVNNTPPAK